MYSEVTVITLAGKDVTADKTVKVNLSRYKPGLSQRVPGS